MHLQLTFRIVERTLTQATTGMGFQFTDPYLYDWLGFAGVPWGVKCADEFNYSGECSNLKICVRSGSTTHEEILRMKFPSKTIIGRDDSSMLLQGLIDSDCHVLAGEQSDISGAGNTGEFVHGTQQLSKEPLGECASLRVFSIPVLKILRLTSFLTVSKLL